MVYAWVYEAGYGIEAALGLIATGSTDRACSPASAALAALARLTMEVLVTSRARHAGALLVTDFACWAFIIVATTLGDTATCVAARIETGQTGPTIARGSTAAVAAREHGYAQWQKYPH